MNEFQYEMLNQALKGMLAGFGYGSGPTRKCEAIEVGKKINPGESVITEELIDVCRRYKSGSYLIVASKIISVSENRIVTIPKYPLPKRRAPLEMQKILQEHARNEIGEVTIKDAIGADLLETTEDNFVFSLLPSNPNKTARDIAVEIRERTGITMDVIITDTSSGWKKGIEFLGIPTLLATPIGSTAGCDIYYAQRLAAMAEVARNTGKLSPYVLVEPPTVRSLTRNGCGEAREYGFLKADGNEVYLEWETT